MKHLIDRNFKLVGLAIVGVILIVLPLLLVNKPFVINVCIVAFIAIVLGLQFSMLFSTGLITLGGAAFYGVGAYASALLATELGLSFWLALPLATIITGIVALGFGLIFVRHAGFSFVVITLLFSFVVVQAAGTIPFFGGWGGILNIPRPNAIGPIEFTSNVPYYYLALFLLALIMLAFYALYNSYIGRAWGAIRLSPHLAQTLGINIYRYRLLAFVIGSSAAGVMGSFYAHYYQVVIPGTFSGWVNISIQLYAVLGGLGFYILGPTIGAVIMTFVPELLRVVKEFEPIITGGMILVIILFFPSGILGTLQKFPHFSLAKVFARIKEIRRWVLTREA